MTAAVSRRRRFLSGRPTGKWLTRRGLEVGRRTFTGQWSGRDDRMLVAPATWPIQRALDLDLADARLVRRCMPADSVMEDTVDAQPRLVDVERGERDTVSFAFDGVARLRHRDLVRSVVDRLSAFRVGGELNHTVHDRLNRGSKGLVRTGNLHDDLLQGATSFEPRQPEGAGSAPACSSIRICTSQFNRPFSSTKTRRRDQDGIHTLQV